MNLGAKNVLEAPTQKLPDFDFKNHYENLLDKNYQPNFGDDVFQSLNQRDLSGG
jgi:hypothetical protein